MRYYFYLCEIIIPFVPNQFQNVKYTVKINSVWLSIRMLLLLVHTSIYHLFIHPSLHVCLCPFIYWPESVHLPSTYQGIHSSTYPSTISVCQLNLKHLCSLTQCEKEILFNNTFNTFYFWLFDAGHNVKDHSDSTGSFICIIAQKGYFIPWPLVNQLWSTGWNEKYLKESTHTKK